MAVLTAAVKREPARHLAQNLLSPFNGSSFAFQTPSVGGDFSFKADLEVEIILEPPGGETYSVDIGSDGKISAFCLVNVYVDSIEFEFAINRAWSAGSLQWVCLKKILGVCVAGFPVIVPRLPDVHFSLDLRHLGINRVPLTSLNASFAVEDLHTTGHIDADNLQLEAKLSLLTVGLFGNVSAFTQNLVHVLFQAVNETLGRIPVLGQVIRYFDGFVEHVVDVILNAAKFAESWENYVLSRVQLEFADRIRNFFDPTIDVKITKVPARKMIAPAVSTPDGHTEPALYANFDSMSLDVNTDCASGPELRAQVAIS